MELKTKIDISIQNYKTRIKEIYEFVSQYFELKLEDYLYFEDFFENPKKYFLDKDKSLLLKTKAKEQDLDLYKEINEIEKVISLLVKVMDKQNSEIDLRIECNERAKKAFDAILQIYLKNQGETIKDNDLIERSFSDPEEREKIIVNYIKENLEQLSDEDLRKINFYFEEYFDMENLMILLEKKLKNKIEKYEKALENIKNNKYTEEDISIYLECLKEAYNNYLNKEFDREFTFRSRDMRNSLHSIETSNGRQELDVRLSIPHDKVLHLMGLKAPDLNDEHNMLAKKFKKYLENHKEEYSLMMNDVTMKDVDTSKLFMIFLFDYLSNDDMRDLSSIQRTEIVKSFQKCINFRKIYEFKMIPEIILDYSPYDPYGTSSRDKNEYKYLRTTEAYTRLGYDHSILLSTLVTLDANEELGFKINDDVKLTNDDIEFIKIVLDNFKDDFPFIRVSGTNKMIKKNNNKIVFRIGDDQYTYNICLKKYRSDDLVNTLLLSYDENQMQFETLLYNCFIRISFVLLAREIANNLINDGIKCDKLKKQINIGDTLRELNKIIEKSIANPSNIELSEFQLLLFEVKQIKKYSKKKSLFANFTSENEEIEFIKQILNNNDLLRDFKRVRLLDLELFIELVNCFMNESNIEFPNFITQFLKDNKVTDYIDEEEYNDLIKMVKSYFASDFATEHSRKIFQITHTNNSEKSLDRNRGGEQPLLNITLKLIEKLNECYYQNNKIDIRCVDTLVSMIGFFVDGNEQDISKEKRKYAKTFMGKTALQVMLDSRLNGWSYKLDTIYGNNEEGALIYYSIIPLIKHNHDLELEYKKIKEAIKIELGTRGYNGPKRR